jgi:hypothetical protein
VAVSGRDGEEGVGEDRESGTLPPASITSRLGEVTGLRRGCWACRTVSVMTPASARPKSPGYRFQVVGVTTIATFSALSWFAWMGWDQEYQVDAATGSQSGPYETWQVAGCALTLLVLFVGALLAGVRPLPASAALALAFTAAWTAQAARADATGLYGVGTIMLLAGLSAATAVVSVVVLRLRDLWVARRRASQPS